MKLLFSQNILQKKKCVQMQLMLAGILKTTNVLGGIKNDMKRGVQVQLQVQNKYAEVQEHTTVISI